MLVNKMLKRAQVLATKNAQKIFHKSLSKTKQQNQCYQEKYFGPTDFQPTQKQANPSSSVPPRISYPCNLDEWQTLCCPNALFWYHRKYCIGTTESAILTVAHMISTN